MTLTDTRKAQLLIWAAKIDLLMAERHLNQSKLARLMDTNPSTVSKLLQGRDSKASTYIAAFEALGVHVEVVP